MSVIMSVYSVQLIEVFCIVNVDRTLKILAYPLCSSSPEITVVCGKWEGPKRKSCC
jgi:hypothetical protein